MHCKDCKWWKKYEHHDYGACESPKVEWMDWQPPANDGCTVDVDFPTGPMFGCVNFEPNE
jgi:hypothetical protein